MTSPPFPELTGSLPHAGRCAPGFTVKPQPPYAVSTTGTRIQQLCSFTIDKTDATLREHFKTVQNMTK